jgi:hypothetical protein
MVSTDCTQPGRKSVVKVAVCLTIGLNPAKVWIICHPYVSHVYFSLCKWCAKQSVWVAAVHIGYDEMDRGAMSNNIGIGAMLLRWKCSVYKVVYREFIIFLILFGIISAVYRNGLDEDQKGLGHFNYNVLNNIQTEFFSCRTFQNSQKFFENYTKLISLPFLLGFYVTIVAGRWWKQ